MYSNETHNPVIAYRCLRHRLARCAGFTIMELLVVVAIILILASLLIVAINQASRAGQRSNTIALMDSIAKGLERFKNDIGYYPPVLGVPFDSTAGGQALGPAVNLRRLFPNSVPNPDAGTYQAHIQEYYSTATMADFLVGWDVGVNDGYGYPAQNETPPSGIRHPSTDGVWDATIAAAPPPADGSLNARNPPLDGQVFGPYLELQDSTIMGSTDGTFNSLGNLNVYFPGQPNYNAAGPMIVCDYWGTPLRYYRRPYPPGAIGQSYRSVDRTGDGVADRVPTLSDVYVLRPWEIKPGTETVNPFADADGKNASTRDLDAAEFALFSAGPDRMLNQNVTVDAVAAPNDQQRNKDNIVKLGPS